MPNRNRRILKKALLAASVIAFMGMASKKAEAKEAPVPETRIEVSETPSYNTESTADFYGQHDSPYIYDRRLSRGLSVKYSGAYINCETGEVLFKAVSRYDEDSHYSSVKRCLESQRLKTGPYDRSKDREIRREQVYDGEYNRGAVVRDVVRGIGEIIRARRGRMHDGKILARVGADTRRRRRGMGRFRLHCRPPRAGVPARLGSEIARKGLLCDLQTRRMPALRGGASACEARQPPGRKIKNDQGGARFRGALPARPPCRFSSLMVSYQCLF